MIHVKTHRPAGIKTLVLGSMLAALLVAGLMFTARPAHADTTFTVTSTVDASERVCVIACTLREAIDAANETPGMDTIEFDIGGTAPVKTISPVTALPQITEAVTIDGYSQPGASPNTLAKGTNAVLKVRLDGSEAGQFSNGLRIKADDVVVRGLVINRFPSDGIVISDGANDPARPTGVRIEGTFIGTDADGKGDLGNAGDGVKSLDGKNNIIGGAAPAARNLISGNERAGVSIRTGPSSIEVEGNLIGTRKDGTSDLGNGDHGVEIFGSSNNTVGGTVPGAANTIAFNDGNGVIVGNGESTADFTGNRILGNSIFANGRLGIDLPVGVEADGSTPNDPKDTDTGANGLQNFPVLSSAKTVAGETAIKGTLNSIPARAFRIEFFSNPSGNEGKRFIGAKSVSTNANGNVAFTFVPSRAVPVGHGITATATTSGNTSEFSAPKIVAAQ